MTVIIDNIAVNYEELGQGEPVLLLHGWGQDIRTFDNMSKELAKYYRVISLDLPGFGLSELPHEDWGVERYAKFTATFLKKLGVERLYGLIGHSFGGRVSIKICGNSIFQVKRLVLIDSAGIKPKVTPRKKFYKIIAITGKAVTSLPLLRKFKHRLRNRLYELTDSTDYINSGQMQNVFMNVIDEDLSEDAKAISICTLLIWGDKDKETPLSDGLKLSNLIEKSRIEILEGGHFIYNEKPEPTFKLIKGFLKDV